MGFRMSKFRDVRPVEGAWGLFHGLGLVSSELPTQSPKPKTLVTQCKLVSNMGAL